jgi:tetratricopeptide (TPR) repeat protein
LKTLSQFINQLKLKLGFAIQSSLYKLEEDAQQQADSLSAIQTKLDDLWPQLINLGNWCEQTYTKDIRAAILLSKLIGVAGRLIHQYLSTQEQIRWREAAYRAANAAKLANDELGHGLQVAYLHFELGNIKRANELLAELERRNAELVESPGDAKILGQSSFIRSEKERKSVEGTILSHRGAFLAAFDCSSEAVPYLERAISIFRGLSEKGALAHCLNTLAVAQASLGKYAEAVKTLDEAIANDEDAVAFINRGSYLAHLDRRDEALKSILDGQRLASESKNKSAIGLAYTQLGFWYASDSDLEKRTQSHQYLNEALQFYRQTGEIRQKNKILKVLDSMFLSVTKNTSSTLEQKAEAWRRLAETREELGELGGEEEATLRLLESAPEDLTAQLEGQIRLGHVRVKQKRYQDAVAEHQKALSILEKIRRLGNPLEYQPAEMELCNSLGQAYRHLNETNKAWDYYTRLLDLANTRNDTGRQWIVKGNLALLLVDRHDFPKAIAELEDVITHYENDTNNRDRLKLLAHAQFNLAYAKFQAGQLVEALALADNAKHLLDLVNDSEGIRHIEEQVLGWENGKSMGCS